MQHAYVHVKVRAHVVCCVYTDLYCYCYCYCSSCARSSAAASALLLPLHLTYPMAAHASVCYLPTRIGALSAVLTIGGVAAAGAALNGRLNVTASTSRGCCRSSNGAVGSLQGLQRGTDVAGMLKHVTAELVHCVVCSKLLCKSRLHSAQCKRS
jgi:hypothetical protein